MASAPDEAAVAAQFRVVMDGCVSVKQTVRAAHSEAFEYLSSVQAHSGPEGPPDTWLQDQLVYTCLTSYLCVRQTNTESMNPLKSLCNCRGSDELVCSVSNGPYIMSTTANGNDSKKFKGDIRGPGVPSRVIHIRKLPNDISETEVISLGLPFGDVTNLLMLKAKNQAFLEMNSEEAAQNMVGYYSTVMPIIRNHPVFVQFSNHKELKTDNSPNQERAQAALRALSSSHVDVAVAAPSSVLRVVVENLVYPVSLDALYQIFSKFGTVLRIIVFTKNSQFQALLQYPDGASAQAAKLVSCTSC
ncbi:hypothetical protein L3Q82_008097 [Scortum barcoo]|uniref:Uncharacterized protein n=1 Tax=Scortum barcoo TaxID=214431 RepID=A0ACB8WKY0_9TELE|nr:hypothetical protein L3Q82_008097 [Scortum barcoo]